MCDDVFDVVVELCCREVVVSPCFVHSRDVIVLLLLPWSLKTMGRVLAPG